MHDQLADPSSSDHVAITNLLACYCLALDVDDIETWVSLFTTDAVYETYGHTWVGHAGLRKMMGGAPRGLHLGGPTLISMLEPNRARTTQNLLFVDAATGAMRRSIYTDELRRTEQGWRIASRRCRFIVADGLADRPGK